jgi:hypothetical protein
MHGLCSIDIVRDTQALHLQLLGRECLGVNVPVASPAGSVAAAEAVAPPLLPLTSSSSSPAATAAVTQGSSPSSPGATAAWGRAVSGADAVCFPLQPTLHVIAHPLLSFFFFLVVWFSSSPDVPHVCRKVSIASSVCPPRRKEPRCESFVRH